MLSDIRDRKLVQWLIAYAAVAWLVVQGLDVATEAFPGLQPVLRTALVLALMGLPMVLVVGWFHGEKGRQRVSLLEAGLLGAIVVITGVLVVHFDVYETDTGPGFAPPPVAELDSAVYAVLPFRHEPEVPATLNAEIQIRDALARWRGIELVEPFRLQDAARQTNGTTHRRLATDAGAGRYVAGSASPMGSAVRLYASVFDTRDGARLAETTVEVPGHGPLSDSVADGIARALLFPGSPAAGTPAATAVGTWSYPARRSFLAALEALDRWRLDRADSLLALALDADPTYARALFWRAQVQAWSGRDPAEVVGFIEAATAVPGGLTEREELMARGLLFLAQREYARSCTAYDALRQLDERSFAAWFGLGECRARDDVVVRDAESPSGWSFRSSYHQAVQSYKRAFDLLPSVYRGISSRTFEQVGERLRVSTGEFRWGRTLPPDTVDLLARPSWEGDTLAFVPYPAEDVYAGRSETRPATQRTAVERQRRLYNAIAEDWVAALPGDPDALAALAHTRELLADPRALETLEAARALTDDPRRRLLLDLERVHLLVKFGAHEQLARARLLADSVLAVGDPADAEEAGRLAVVAALTGHVGAAARWAAQGAGPRPWPVTIPVAATSPAAALETFAAMGGPADSVRAYERAVEGVLEHRMPPEDREAARTVLLDRAASMAYPTHPLASMQDLADRSPYALLRAEAAHQRGEVSEAIGILDRIRDLRRRSEIRPAEVSFDALFAEAWLWSELGDTATAIVMLDESLNTLRWAEPGSLGDVPRAASLVRAMALRAELADAVGDRPIALRWASAVATLWGGADPGVRPLTRRMHGILEDDDARSDLAPRSNPQR